LNNNNNLVDKINSNTFDSKTNTNNNNTPARRMIGSIMDLLSGGGGGLISPDKALKGRTEKMAGISGLKHYILGNPIDEVPPGYEVCIFGNGCFWGSEKSIWRLPKGIHSTAVGYCAGYTPNPTYNEACSSMTGHTEAVRVVYNPNLISYVDIMRMFWESHDPTQYMGQGNDRGSQYRSGIYYFNDDQKRLIESSKAAYEAALGGGRTIKTEIAAASDYDKYGGLWYFAEPYHQQYLAKPGSRPYCSAQPQGVSLPPFESWAPEDLKEKYKPTLPESFWKKHGPVRGCSIVRFDNEPISEGSY
jgi:peptide-methionine (S)-S-oxide reductase